MWLVLFILLILAFGVGGAIKGLLWLLFLAVALSVVLGAVGGPRYWRR